MDDRATVDMRPRWRRRLENAVRDPYAALMWLVGDHSMGGESVPTTWRNGYIESTRDGSRIAVGTADDASGLTMRRIFRGSDGAQDEMAVYDMSRREVRALVWWIVRWYAADWFGIRRRIYFWALHRHVTQYHRRWAR